MRFGLSVLSNNGTRVFHGAIKPHHHGPQQEFFLAKPT